MRKPQGNFHLQCHMPKVYRGRLPGIKHMFSSFAKQPQKKKMIVLSSCTQEHVLCTLCRILKWQHKWFIQI